jgi:ubiquinone/menaquinone biosynthesis C-methylase UbiE
MNSLEAKDRVREFWNRASCGEQLYLKGEDKAAFTEQRRIRYALEPIEAFARFESFRAKKTLEIGVGLGADHQSLAEAGADLTGVDLTERAVEFTRARFELFGLKSDLKVGDAENLPFRDGSFDAVYSWGVIHHSPDTPRAAAEILRVLKPGGFARVMIYHKWSMVGYMLWLRYGLCSFRPWRDLRYIYSNYLESPGTQAFTVAEARQMFRNFSQVHIATPVGHGDLLTSDAGQRHGGVVLAVARRIWPRWFIRRFLGSHGLGMMIDLRK